MPSIKQIVGFDGFAGVDVILADNSEDKICLFRGSADPGLAVFPPDWKCTTVPGPKMTLPELAMMCVVHFESSTMSSQELYNPGWNK